MDKKLNRREMLKLSGGMLLAGAIGPRFSRAADRDPPENPHGVVAGDINGSPVGNSILATGGNAVDAIVAAALTVGVTAVQSCGIGGYGGTMVIALAGAKTITSIDFNTTAPAAARPDMFPLDAKGNVIGRVNDHGWLASGVPGSLGGLQLAIDRYGTRSFRELVAPAIQFAKGGFPVTADLADAIRRFTVQLKKDAGSAKLFFRDGEALRAGDTFRNPDLAKLLETLASRNSANSFYRGDIAQQIADGFRKNGGLVTAPDLAAYQARELQPLELSWRGFTINTTPLTSGGLTVLQALAVMKAMNWDRLPAGFARTHARVEALRLAWYDRLALFGDPEMVSVPVKKILSAEYAHTLAVRAEAAVRNGTPIAQRIIPRDHTGTIHLSAVDRQGNLAALTLTHGNGFGAQVTVDGLGLILGHGMSRFEPHPGHPNSVAAGKRPLHNMCPAIVLREGKPLMALGGRGGRKIPNAVIDVLTRYIAEDSSLKEAIAAPRLSTDGGLELSLEQNWPANEVEQFRKLGYATHSAASAIVSAVEFDARSGECRASWR